MGRRAYRVCTPRLVIRCWDPEDAPLLAEAITESLEHLRPWMPWVESEPEPLDAKIERLRRFRGAFDLDDDYVYGIFDPEEKRVLGGTGLHTRVGPEAREIGYWIHADHVGRGYATETAAALTRVAFEVDEVARMEIHCDPANGRSAAVPRKLGYTHDGTLRRGGGASDGGRGETMIWSMLRHEFPTSPAAEQHVEAYDVVGERLI